MGRIVKKASVFVKQEALKDFTERLRETLGNRVTGIYLYGSMAKGTVDASSDIDVLITFKGIERAKLLDVVSDITFDIACKHRELIEPILLPDREFRRRIGRSPFLWEVLEGGQKIFATEAATEWKLEFGEHLKLAEEYLQYARGALKDTKIRLAIDTGYNAIELSVKALITSTKTKLASSHGGVVGQFGELFVKTGKVGRELGKGTHKALALRAQARYVPSARLSKADGEFVVSLAGEILEIAERELGE